MTVLYPVLDVCRTDDPGSGPRLFLNNSLQVQYFISL